MEGPGGIDAKELEGLSLAAKTEEEGSAAVVNGGKKVRAVVVRAGDGVGAVVMLGGIIVVCEQSSCAPRDPASPVHTHAHQTKPQPPQDKGMDLVKAVLATQGGAMGATASGGNSSSSAGASGEDAAYLEAHPEARAALNDFVSALLLEKPEVRVWVWAGIGCDGWMDG